jgi:hypothetical protein
VIRELAEEVSAWLDTDPDELAVVDELAPLEEFAGGATVCGSTTWFGGLELLERELCPPLETELAKVVDVVDLGEELTDVLSDVF